MKVTLKQLSRYIPVICILSSLLLIGGGLAMTDFKMENLQMVEHEPYMKRERATTIHQVSSIRIDNCHSEINILPARDDNIRIQYEKDNEYLMNVTKDTTFLQLKRTTRNSQFDFFDLDREFDILTAIELSETFHGKLNIDTSYDSMTIHNMAYQGITISNDYGNVSPFKLKAGAVALDVAYGSVAPNDVNGGQVFQLNSEYGDIISGNLRADSAVPTTACSGITLDDTRITKDMTLYHEHAPVNLRRLRAQALQIESTYDGIRNTGLTIAEDVNFSLERSGVTPQELFTKDMTMENAYGNTMISEPDADSILMEDERGNFSATVRGSIDNFNILSEAEHRDNTLPTKYENSSRRKLQINVEYGDINVKF